MSIVKKYKGVVIPAVTPLTENYKLDHEGLEKMFYHFYANGVSPFIIGTTGESASLSFELKIDYIAAAARLKQQGTILYAGIASNCVEETVELAKVCADAGVDVVAATLPSYYALTESQVKTYFEQLADASPLPLVIYNIPATTHMSIPLAIIDDLSHHENIVGTKDSERSDERLQQSINLWKEREDFSHFLGWAARSAKALLDGSDGLIPSTGNLHPGLYTEMWHAAAKNYSDKAYRLQDTSDILGNLYQGGRTLGESLWALKVLMQDKGLCKEYVMPPLQPGTAAEREKLIYKLEAVMQAEAIIM